MILLCGIPTEPPLARVQLRLEEAGADYTVLNQRQVATTNDIDVDIAGESVTGELRLGDRRLGLDTITAVYTRLMDHRLLPEVRAAAPDSTLSLRSSGFQDVFLQWCEVTPALVVNRIAAMGSNGSKPYQAQLIARHGFSVPDTLITNDPQDVLEFLAQHDLIYKSMSGVRSIVHRFAPIDRDRLERIRWCPVQFQEFIDGRDVRVHCVGQQAFATSVESSAVDYRYAGQLGYPSPTLTAISLEDDLAQRCLDLVEALGLAFAGIDLRITPEGRTYCFEVNPCPGYTYYEAMTGQPISRALAQLLMRAPGPQNEQG